MAFPEQVKEDVLIACGRHCSLCHRFCGLKIELHHIRLHSEKGRDTFDNCIPLCFDCHADMRSYDHKHPKGTKYTEQELVGHRDAWYSKVQASNGTASSNEYIELDRELAKSIVRTLPWQGVIQFLRDHDFAGGFDDDNIDAVYKFQWACDNPAFEFFDIDLEGSRVELLRSVYDFTEKRIGRIFPVKGMSINRVSIPDEWLPEQEQRFWSAVKVMNEASSKIVENYIAFIRLTRRKLGINLE